MDRKLAEIERAKPEALLRGTIDSSPDMIWVVDCKHFRLLAYNRSFKEYCQSEYGVLVEAGMDQTKLFPPGSEFVERWNDYCRRALTNAPYTVDYTTSTKARVIELTFNLVGEDERVLGISVFGKDITEKKRLESAARQSGEKFRKIFMSNPAPLAIYDITDDARLVDVNPAWQCVTGYLRDEVIGSHAAKLGIMDSSVLEDFLRRIKKDGAFREVEFAFRRRNGESGFALGSAEAIEFQEKRLMLAAWVVTTDCKLAEEALKESEQRYRTVFENTGAATIIFHEIDTTISLCNAEFERLSGYSRSEIEGKKSWTEFVAPEDLDRMLHLGRIRREKPEEALNRYDFRFVSRCGEIRNIYLTIDRIPGTENIVASLTDITERVGAEEALRKREALFRAVVDKSHAGVVMMDKEDRIVYLSPSYTNIVDYSSEEIVGMFGLDLVHPDDRAGTSKKLAELHQKPGASAVAEYRLTHKLGHWVWVETIATNLLEDPHVNAVVLSIRDITERKATEEKLKEQADAMEASAVGIAILDKDQLHVYANRAYAKVCGYDTSEELIGKSWRVLYHDDELQRFECDIMPQFRKSGQWKGEATGKRKDESYFPQDLSLTALDNGGLICIVQDITNRREMRDALKESEEKYRTIFENAMEGIFQTTPEGRLLSANPALARICGYNSPAEIIDLLVDLNTQLYVQPEDRVIFKDFLQKHGFVERFEAQLYRKDRSKVWVSMNAQAVADASGKVIFEGAFEDITMRKQSEEELRSAHRRLSDIIDFLPDATFVIDHDKKVIAWNKAIEEMTGVKKEEMLGKGDYAYAVPFYGEPRPITIDLVLERNDEMEKTYDNIQREDNKLSAEVYVPMTYRGRGAYLSAAASPLFDHEGNVVGAIESIRDTTEQKRIDKALQESEERYRVAIESSNDGIALVREGRHVYVNRKFLDIFGYSSLDEVEGKTHCLTVHPDDLEEVVSYNRRRLSGEAVPDRYEFKGLRKNGDTVYIEASVTRTTYQGEPISLAFMRDVTERKHLEDQLRQAQKMEAIGTLAGGVAHDFNNILTVIMGLGNLIQMSIDKNDVLKSHVDQIVASSERAAELTQSLLAFSRKQRITLQPLKVNEVVTSTAKLLRRLLPEDIDITCDLADKNTLTMLDITHIGQVLMNLATNARDAMPHGGSLTITTERVTLDESFKKIHGFGRPGNYVKLSVSDTGAGMNEQTLSRIFEPFFTTKEVGKGTGLGLASAYGTVKQHNGYITVSSLPFKGTTFDIYLPLIDTPQPRRASAATKTKGGAETILIVEDDRDVRNMLTKVLEGHGYTTIEAVDGDDAIKRHEEHKGKVDLVILDVVIPGKSGKEVFDEITRINPSVKAVFVSGYTGDVVIDKGIQSEGVDFLQKPLSVPKLLAKVREVLDR
jgi:PAS domain S-box-containing protein